MSDPHILIMLITAVEMATATVTHLKEAAAVAAVGTTRLRGVLLQAAVSG